jgi:hypothetical protein
MYLGMIITNQNLIHKGISSILNVESARYILFKVLSEEQDMSQS